VCLELCRAWTMYTVQCSAVLPENGIFPFCGLQFSNNLNVFSSFFNLCMYSYSVFIIRNAIENIGRTRIFCFSVIVLHSEFEIGDAMWLMMIVIGEGWLAQGYRPSYVWSWSGRIGCHVCHRHNSRSKATESKRTIAHLEILNGFAQSCAEKLFSEIV